MRKLLIAFSALMLVPGCSKTGKIDQPGNNAPAHFKILADPAASQFDNTGGDGEITIESNYPWTASLPEDAYWVEFAPEGISTGDGSVIEVTEVSIVVAPNNTEAERTATITFTSEGLTETFIVTQSASFLAPSIENLNFTYPGETRTITVSSNLAWEAAIEPSVTWCGMERNGNSLTFTAEPNDGSVKRRATLRFTTDVGISKDVPITQFSIADNYGNKEVVLLHEATKGKGVNIVMMGEGYTLPLMARGGGKYETDMRDAAEYFLSVYPYSAYREYFNIWMVTAISNEEGMSVTSPAKAVDTVFDCVWAGDGSTMLSCKLDTAKEYAQLVATQAGANIDDILAIMPINADVYAGTCYMNVGFSVAMCPTSSLPGGKSFRNLTIHETCGHGFAKLADEYISPGRENRTIPSYDKLEIDIAQKTDEMQLNLSTVGDIARSPWAGMADNPKYTGGDVDPNNKVGMFEGAGYYGKGLWRSERNSCMNDNVLYFNAVSRWSAVRRIKRLSGEDDDYTIEEFMRDDVIPAYPTETRASSEPFIPLGRPIIGSRN